VPRVSSSHCLHLWSRHELVDASAASLCAQVGDKARASISCLRDSPRQPKRCECLHQARLQMLIFGFAGWRTRSVASSTRLDLIVDQMAETWRMTLGRNDPRSPACQWIAILTRKVAVFCCRDAIFGWRAATDSSPSLTSCFIWQQR
jgi:hypothetical protein